MTKLRGTPEALTTTSLIEISEEGSRLITEPDGKNVKDWAIRSQDPKLAIARAWVRFNDLMIMGLK
jgi:hypothetical protein